MIGLNDVTVAVPPGITGLLGPNGAGKSTFMKLDHRPAQAEQGQRSRVLGEPIWGNPALYFRIGFCPEQDAFYERMTGLEWVTALVRLNGLGETEAADAATGRARTRGPDATPRTRRSAPTARACASASSWRRRIVHDPELLILDEPLSGMDPIARRKTIRLIKDWARAGKSIIVSSHILHEIESMTSNILLINNGRILAEGNVHQIRDLIDEHPHTVYIRAERPARARAPVPRRRRRAEPEVRAGRGGRADGEARRVLRAADRAGRERRGRDRSTRSRRPTTTCRPSSSTW